MTQHEVVRAHLHRGLDVVADDTNLDPAAVRAWLGWADRHGFQLAVRDFPVELDVALARNEARGLKVPPQVIVRMYEEHTDDGALPNLFNAEASSVSAWSDSRSRQRRDERSDGAVLMSPHAPV